LAVDSLGFPFFTHCTRANVTDDQGLIEMLTAHIDYFQEKPLDLPKTTILLDHGYHPDKIQTALEAVYPEIMTKIQFEVSVKPSKAEKAAQGKSGFVPVRCAGCTPSVERSSMNDRMHGWNVVRIWSRTLNGTLNAQEPS
jgi:hypothetical protein